MKTFLFRVLPVLLLLAALCFVAVPHYIIKSRMPDLNADVAHESLSAEVSVTRDNWGVAHIEAQNATDAYFAFGYTVAQDRLFQLEVLRRLGRGELSEIIGDKGLEIDKISRTLLWRKSSEDLFKEKEKFDPEFVAIVDAFISGVNHFVATNPMPIEYTVLGFEPKPFTPEDSLSLMGYMAYGFAEGIRADSVFAMIAEKHPDLDMSILFPGYSRSTPISVMEGIGVAGEPEVVAAPVALDESASAKPNYSGLENLVAMVEDTLPQFGAFYGSNSWVLSPDRSTSGGAILANDPHIGFTNPGVWYECHIKYPGYESYGVHLPLIPFPVIAHNSDKAWSMTMFENDDVDLYRETIKPDDASKVKYKGEWADVQEWTETISVKDADPVELTIRITPHGPIITDMLDGYKGDPVSLWWLFHDADHDNAQTFYKLGLAKNVEEAREASALLIAPGLNISYADKEGNIAWWAAGRLPIRPDHVNAKTILDGASGDDEVLGYLPFSENPQLVNPPSGVIVTSNNMSTSRPVGPIENLEGYWQPSDRAWRILELLDEQEKWSLEDLKIVQTDVKLQTGDLLRDAVVEAMEEIDSDGRSFAWKLSGDARTAYAALKDWNSGHAIDSVGATVHQFAYDATRRGILLDELGETLLKTYLTVADHRNFLTYVLTDPDCPLWDDTSTSETETANDILRAGFRAGVENMVGRLGKDWSWGKAHTVAYPYLILGEVDVLKRWWEIGPYPAPSHKEGVAKMSWRDESYDVKHGASMRLLLDYANYGKAEGMWFVLPTGNSGHILNRQYKNQAEMYLNGIYRNIHFSDEDIQAHKKYSATFRPGSSVNLDDVAPEEVEPGEKVANEEETNGE
jgi:penicillin amidase